MRRLVVVVALLAALAGGGATAPAAQAGCAFIVVWHDRAYWQVGGGPAQADPGGTALEGAMAPACNDTVGADEPACILVVVWHDQAYFAIGSPETLPAAGAAVHAAVEPGCNDTGGGVTELPTPVAARRVAGVPPGLALLVRDTVLVAHGYIAGLPSATTLPTDATRGCRLGGPVRITGPANVGLGSLSVHVSDSTVRLHHLLRGAAHIVVDGGTRIEGLVRRGQAYIGEGQLVQVDARFCMVPGSIGTKIVARHITPAGPIVPASTAEDILGDDWRGKPGIVSKATDGHALAVAIVLLVAAIGIGTALTAHRRRSLHPPRGNLTGCR